MQDHSSQEIRNLLLLPNQLNLSDTESDIIKTALSNPSVKKYLQILLHNSIMELLENEIETKEQETTFKARFNKLKGIQYVTVFLLNNFQPEPAKQAESKGS